MFGLEFNLFNNEYFIYERLIVLVASLIPSILLLIIALYTDRKSKEPMKNILICLGSGILTIALSKYLEELVMPYISNNIILIYIWAFIEELSKLLIFVLFIFDNKYYDEIYDGIVYMALIALSFAGLENIMYAFSESTVIDSISLALMRDFTTVPLHIFCGIVIGHFMSLANFSKEKNIKIKNMILAIFISSLIHGTFNLSMNFFSIIDQTNPIVTLLFILMPMLLIIFIIFYGSYKITDKNLDLNYIYMNNKEYEEKYNYLMNKKEYLDSSLRRKQIKFYNINTFNRSDNNDIK